MIKSNKVTWTQASDTTTPGQITQIGYEGLTDGIDEGWLKTSSCCSNSVQLKACMDCLFLEFSCSIFSELRLTTGNRKPRKGEPHYCLVGRLLFSLSVTLSWANEKKHLCDASSCRSVHFQGMHFFMNFWGGELSLQQCSVCITLPMLSLLSEWVFLLLTSWENSFLDEAQTGAPHGLHQEK